MLDTSETIAQPLRIIAALLITLTTVLLMVYAGSILIPIIFALCVWMILVDTGRWLGKFKFGSFQLPMWLSTLVGLLIFALVIVRIGAVLTTNLSELVSDLPSYATNLNRLLLTIPESFWRFALGDDIDMSTDIVNRLVVVGSVYLGESASVLAGSAAAIGSNIAYVLVYVTFLLLEQGTFAAKVTNMFRTQAAQLEFEHIIESIRMQVQTYLRVKTMVSFATAIISYVIMMLFGLEYAFVWAILFFVLNFIPNIGSIIAVTFPSVMALLQFPELSMVVILVVALIAVQMVIGNFVEPRLLGNQLNISPLVVLIALVVFGTIWGITGAFLSVPLTVVLMIVLSHFESTRFVAVMLSGDGVVHDLEAERAGYKVHTGNYEGHGEHEVGM